MHNELFVGDRVQTTRTIVISPDRANDFVRLGACSRGVVRSIERAGVGQAMATVEFRVVIGTDVESSSEHIIYRRINADSLERIDSTGQPISDEARRVTADERYGCDGSLASELEMAREVSREIRRAKSRLGLDKLTDDAAVRQIISMATPVFGTSDHSESADALEE